MAHRFRSSLLWVSLCLLAAAALAETPDNYEAVRVPRGLHQGKLLDTSWKRTLRVLDTVEGGPYRVQPTDLVVTNFLHRGQFWIARIPQGAVETVYFHKEVFPAVVPAAHTQLRFHLKPGHEAVLFPQYAGAEAPEPVADVVFSVDAVQVPGDVFDVWRGLWNHFGLALRLQSLEEVYYRSIFARGHTIEQIKLVLSDKQRQAAFADAIQRADEAKMSRMYNTILRSCTTSAFGILDEAIHGAWYFLIPTSLPHILPVLPRTYLRFRGLIATSDFVRNATPSLNVELAHLADEPSFPERKKKDDARQAALRAAFLAGQCTEGLVTESYKGT